MSKPMRVAIVPREIEKGGYELIGQAFADVTMFELCTPIVYGIAPEKGKAKDKESGIPAFHIINNATEAQDGRLNLLRTEEKEALAKAVADHEARAVEAIVACLEMETGNDTERIYADERVRILIPKEGYTPEENAPLSEKLRLALRREFMLSNPRIALLAAQVAPKVKEEPTEENPPVPQTTIEELMKNGGTVYGPYAADPFIEEREYEAFDGILPESRDLAQRIIAQAADGRGAVLVVGLPYILTEAWQPAENAAAATNDEAAAGQSLRSAIYMAEDAIRRRINYDRPYHSPLPKLYHEKKDESEKVRFAVPKARPDKKNGGPAHKQAPQTQA